MKEVEHLANYVTSTKYDDLSKEAINTLKIRVLDSLGCAIGALNSPVIAMLKAHLADFGGSPLVTLIGDKKTSPDRAALFNSALVRYLDFNDSFLAKKETCHPSDNLGSVLAACEYAKSSGKHFLLSLGIAYQVQCRLSEEAPVRDKGFDHTTQGVYAVAAGVAKALKLNSEQTSHAIAIAGVANNALRVTRTGALSHWKGLAYPQAAFAGTHSAFLAYRNITGPLEIFEGNKGFKHAIAGPFKIHWNAKDLDIVLKTILKKYNAEIHSQSTLEGLLELRNKYRIDPTDIQHVHLEIFDVAFNIIGGGEEGSKKLIRTKEEADHSLPYMMSAALLDGEVTPRQYTPQRIKRKDIQTLLKKIDVHPNKQFSKKFPKEMPAKITIKMKNGQTYTIQKNDYEGFISKPMSWEHAREKFDHLTEPFTNTKQRNEIADAILHLDKGNVSTLTNLLGKVHHER